MNTITTIFADLDGSGVRPLYARQDVDLVQEALDSGKLVKCDSALGEVRVGASAVKYIQPGRRDLPVSSGPSNATRASQERQVGGKSL